MSKFNLGDKVKDRVTQFEGVIITRDEWFGGNTRFDVQPQKLKDEKPIESYAFDQGQLELVSEKAVEPVEITTLSTWPMNGEECKDKITGLKGKVVGVHYYLNGCVYATVQPDIQKDGKFPDRLHFDIHRLEKTGKSVPEPVKSTFTGGPNLVSPKIGS